ncbi:MAG: xylulokinase, partial [Streptosporangiaceae bacterium]|nr:xylulokinase [Streptosporangiaceae bacterium]
MNADARPPVRAADRRDTTGPVCALGLDLGTSSAKAVVIDTRGTVLSQASAGYPVTSAMAGYAESEPAHWWAAV